MLKIGVTAGFMYPDLERKVFGHKFLAYVETEMMDLIACRPDILPVLLPNYSDDILFGILENLDAFVFTGGADLAPESYSEKPIEGGKWKGDMFRDTYELKIMDYAFKSGKPLIGICRGIQLLNVYLGGTLYQDITTQNSSALVHRDAEVYDRLTHEIKFIDGTFMAELFKNAPSKRVNSVHHQGIKDLGKDLEVLAVSPDDGIIEAIGYTKAPDGHVFGVQFHPEFSKTLLGKKLDTRPVYEYFLDRVIEYKKDSK